MSGADSRNQMVLLIIEWYNDSLKCVWISIGLELQIRRLEEMPQEAFIGRGIGYLGCKIMNNIIKIKFGSCKPGPHTSDHLISSSCILIAASSSVSVTSKMDN